ncbi:hypothetical protein ES705_33092 [subsurface metagenome]
MGPHDQGITMNAPTFRGGQAPLNVDVDDAVIIYERAYALGTSDSSLHE